MSTSVDGLSPYQQSVLDGMDVSLEQVLFYTAKKQQGQYLLLAGLCLLIYDYALTFGNEVMFIWRPRPRFSWAKFLFFLNRYYPIVNTGVRWWVFTQTWTSAETCQPFLSFTAYSAIVNFATVEIVLLLRVWVLYDRGKAMGWTLLALFLVAFGTALGVKVAKLGVNALPFNPIAPQVLTQCKRTPASEVFYLYAIGLLVETTSFLLLCRKAYASARQSLTTPILTPLLMHGAVYYAVVCAALAITMASPLVHPLYQPMADANFIVCITSVTCNRLILSLRGMAFTQGAIKASDMFDNSGRIMMDDMNAVDQAYYSNSVQTSRMSHPVPGRIVPTVSYGGTPHALSHDMLEDIWELETDEKKLRYEQGFSRRVYHPYNDPSIGLSSPTQDWGKRPV